MSDVIQLLPDSVANQIAAGEVIQRPASVIKELVENSIDAGASHIKVLVCDAGKASIQVIDDGCGMSDTDARLSFERHATSKIRQAMDLFSLHTMGFRGEALASIAAVAQVTLQTRREEDELGTKIRIDGSRLVNQEIVSCPVGSNFLIENLFFNIPARRKFLKSNATEMNNITQAFERMVLVYPDKNFSLYSNGQQLLDLRATNFHQRIIDVFGKRLNQYLLPVSADTTVCKIEGFVGKPESSRKKGVHQFFFVNGRYMKHPYFHKAVMSAFDRLLPNGEQVPYFLNFTVNPEDIDVNIHPVKTEIKFENEQVIWQILMAAVRDAVGKFAEVSTLDFDSIDRPDIPVFNPLNKDVEVPSIDFNPMYNPFKETSEPESMKIQEQHSVKGASSRVSVRSARGWDEMFKGLENEIPKKPVQMEFGTELGTELGTKLGTELGAALGPSDSFVTGKEGVEYKTVLAGYDDDTPLVQHSARYIIAAMNNDIAIIDQHRASIRVLYERYMECFAGDDSDQNGSGEIGDFGGKVRKVAHTQKVLFPDDIQFPPSYGASLEEILDELRTLGFEIKKRDSNTYTIEGMPAGLGGLDSVQLVSELVADAIDHCSCVTSQIHSLLAQGLAKRAAIPYGEILSTEEQRGLLRQLIRCESQVYTPDGKKVVCLLGEDDLSRMFR